jgi:predicted nucleic acid-binding protein
LSSAYVDSSFLLAIAFGEPNPAGLAEKLDRFDAVYASDLVEAEVLSALVREEMVLPEPDSFSFLSWTFPDRPLTPEFQRILKAGHLEGADLWHLACALYLSPAPGDLSFLTLDTRQKRIAAKLGFSV